MFTGKPTDLERISLFGAVRHFGGGGKGGGDGFDFPEPTPIDPSALIREQAEANRIDVTSPFGNVRFGGPNRREMTVTLSPEQQQMLDQAQQTGIGLGGIAQGLAGQLPTDAFQFSGLPGLPGADDFGAERSRVEGAVFDRALGLLQPQFEQQQEALESNLAARGIPLGSELRGREMGNLQDVFNRSLAQAANDAVLAGGSEQSRLFNQAQSARAQLGQEQLTERTQPLAEIAGLLGQQTIQQPMVVPPSPVDVIGPNQLASNQQMGLFGLSQQSQQAAQARQAAMVNSLIQAGGNIGAFALMGL